MSTITESKKKDKCRAGVKNSELLEDTLWNEGHIATPRFINKLLWQLPQAHRDMARYFIDHGGIWGKEFPEVRKTISVIARDTRLGHRRVQQIIADLCELKFFVKKEYGSGVRNRNRASGFKLTPELFYAATVKYISSRGEIHFTQSKKSSNSKNLNKKISSKEKNHKVRTYKATEIRKPVEDRVQTHIWNGRNKNGNIKRPTLSIVQAIKEMTDPRPIRVRNVKYKTFTPVQGARASPDEKDEANLAASMALLDIARKQLLDSMRT